LSDPPQSTNVATQHPEVAKALHGELMAFLRGICSPAAERMVVALAGTDSGVRARGQDAPDYRGLETR
jgi:hypothetical protein